jgi:hypothetical protein
MRRRSLPLKLVERDRQIPHALTGGVIDALAIAATLDPISPTPLMPSGLTPVVRLTDED